MLTAEHVRARRSKGELIVRSLREPERLRARDLAEAFLELARGHVGRRRDELVEAWSGVPIAPAEKRLADGLRKLIEDGSEFAARSPADPIELRDRLFLAAAAARRALSPGSRFDRAALVAAAATERNLSPDDIEQSLYADLKSEELLATVGPFRADALVDAYDRGQAQAVLLRAVRVVAEVQCRSPAAYRALFRELKFRRLLHRIEPHAGGYRIEIDGPYSLFESVTKYGLQLALVLPALEACDALSLVADIRWGKDREPLVFRHHRRADPDSGAPDLPVLRDDVAALVEAFRALGSAWRVKECTEILDLPGIGVCVPDLVFERARGERVHFEALGFWSRDAVWKRVELVQQGLSRPILFAVSSRLRVSEAVLDEVETASLYVYKGVMSARAVERKLEALAPKRR